MWLAGSAEQLKDAIAKKVEETIRHDSNSATAWTGPTTSNPEELVTRVSGILDPDVSSVAFEVSQMIQGGERDKPSYLNQYTFLAYLDGSKWHCIKS